jgi:hypothetical protein
MASRASQTDERSGLMWRSEVAAIPIITNMMPADHPLFRCAEMPTRLQRDRAARADTRNTDA